MAEVIDLTGKRFGKWEVIQRANNDKDGNSRWLCKCDCGNIKEVNGYSLRSGKSLGCGKYKKTVFTELSGKRFGRWTVIKLSTIRCGKGRYWECICDCKTKKLVREDGLLLNTSQSCGCLAREKASERGKLNIKHGHTRNKNHTKIYRAWHHMIERCTNQSNNQYKNYGNRGITVCQEWLSFENFLYDMGNPPTIKHEIDRINNNKGYYKENCRWATRKEQCRNKRDNNFMTYNNETKILRDWANEFKIHERTLGYRIKSGWSIEKALNTPGRRKNK